MIRYSIEAVYIAPPVPSGVTPKRASIMPEMSDRLRDPNASIGDLQRLITIEMAHLVEAMRKCEEMGAPISELKFCGEQIRVLRQLFRTFVEFHTAAKREVLNIRGRKFQIAFYQIHKCLRAALEESSRSPDNDLLNQTILRNFRDEVAAHEEDIQRAVDEIDSSADRSF
jgi:hypothetical protein